MSADKTATANIIVLRKIRYQESGLIIASISPQLGRLDFIAKGARRLGGKKYPEIDLFRELEVKFREKDQGLLTPLSIELIENNDAIAEQVEAFMKMENLASFLLKNIHHGMPCPAVYASLARALALCRMAEPAYPWDSLVKLVYLDENGLLSDRLSHNEGVKDEKVRRNALTALLRLAVNGGPAPAFATRFWRRLEQWIGALCVYHGL